MQYQTSIFVSALALLTSVKTRVLQRQDTQPVHPQIEVSNFYVGSSPSEGVNYELDTKYGVEGAYCHAYNQVSSPTCTGADGPAAFGNTTCQQNTSTTGVWSWELQDAQSPTQPPQDGFSLKISYQIPGAAPVYGCRWLAYDVLCSPDTTDPNLGVTTLAAPSAFNMTVSENSECVYA